MSNDAKIERVIKVIDWLIFDNIIKNRRELAKILSYTESSLSQILNGKVDLSARFIKKLSLVDSRISLKWIESGGGAMLQNNKDYKDSLEIRNSSVSNSEINPRVGIPLIPAFALAGAFNGEISILEYECERFIIPTFKGADFLISVKGSSMIPKYSSGDIVACKKLPIDTFFQWGKVYVLDTDQGPLIKKVKKGSDPDSLLILSENTDFEPFELSRSAIYHIALVMGVIRLE